MGRWAHLDTDEERLPEGVTRIGYDADDQTYSYHDAKTGRYYVGPPGCRYGQLRLVTLTDAYGYKYSDASFQDAMAWARSWRKEGHDKDNDEEGEKEARERRVKPASTENGTMRSRAATTITRPASEHRNKLEKERRQQSQAEADGDRPSRSNTLTRIARFIRRGSGDQGAPSAGHDRGKLKRRWTTRVGRGTRQ